MVPARQPSRRAGQPDVGEGGHDGTRPRSRRPPARRSRGSPTRPGPWPELRGSPPSVPGLGDAASDGQRDQRASHASQATAATCAGARSRSRDGADDGQPEPDRDRARARRPGKPPRRAAGAGRRRSGRASPRRGSSVVSTSGRPRPADQARLRRPSSRLGHAEHDRVLDRRDLLDPAAGPASRVRSRAARDRGRRPRCRPIRAGRRRARRRARRRRRRSPSRPSRTSNGTRSRPSSNVDPAVVAAELEARPAEDERAVGVVLELVLGIDPAADPDVARPGRRPAPAPRRR